MEITTESLDALRAGFSAAYQSGLGMAESQWSRIATEINSTTAKNTYGWLGDFPTMKEWIGARQIEALSKHSYTIENVDFEVTVSVDRNDIEDDNIGIYRPKFEDMGMSVAQHPDTLVYGLLADGFTEECYDGQNFFDTDHPVGESTVSNVQAGGGPAWYLLHTKRPLKPLILQTRKTPEFTSLDRTTDPNVFFNKKYIYGADSRRQVGFGYWQMARASQGTLDEANYAAARAAMMELKGDKGKPLGLVPDLLVVPPSLEGAARRLLMNQKDDAGADNPWYNTAEPLVVPWLT